ncbi:hypothetical protein [Hymenobacter elongatus]|uniref:Uncharacterized protein n=1 Tax=Hymenobacter elongatus TaxID=877208 RepID=A0A4Z0PSH4_9BACT|nr:hypothetical protein [Hymenobacter elongatus]TGE19951.1 hypothetical protein E5J99_02310 [Hymenobacter elongatus]
MKQIALSIFLFCNIILMQSCDLKKIAAGSYAHAERYYFDCSSDSVVGTVSRLKATGLYTHKESPPDHVHSSNKDRFSYYFYFREKHFIVHLVIEKLNDETTEIAVVGLKDAVHGSDWLVINKDVPASNQAQALQLFDSVVKSRMHCSTSK